MAGVFKIASFFAEGFCGSGVHGQILAVVGLRRVFLTKTVIVIKSSKWNGIYFSIWCLMRTDTCKFLLWWPGTCKNAKKLAATGSSIAQFEVLGARVAKVFARISIRTHLAHKSLEKLFLACGQKSVAVPEGCKNFYDPNKDIAPVFSARIYISEPKEALFTGVLNEKDGMPCNNSFAFLCDFISDEYFWDRSWLY